MKVIAGTVTRGLRDALAQGRAISGRVVREQRDVLDLVLVRVIERNN